MAAVLPVEQRAFIFPGAVSPGAARRTSGDGVAVLATYDDVRRRAPDAPILVHSHSLGTWAAVSVAGARPVPAPYLEAPFRSMASLVSGLFPWLPTELLLRDPMRSDLKLPASGRALAAARPGDTRFDLVPAGHVTVIGAEDAIWEPRFAALVCQACRRG